MMKNPGTKWAILTVIVGLAIWVMLTQPTQYGVDLQGGSVLHYRVDTTGYKGDARGVIDESIAVMERRTDKLGVKEMEFTSFGSDEIKIQIPGVDQKEVEEIQRVLTELGKLEFRIVAKDE